MASQQLPSLLLEDTPLNHSATGDGTPRIDAMAEKGLALLGETLQINVPANSEPTGSEDKRNQQQSRKRTAKACDSCYKKKIKCDAAVPRCDWCSYRDIPCTFERTIQRRRKVKDQGREQHKPYRLSERLSKVEKFLMAPSGESSERPDLNSLGPGDLMTTPPNRPLALPSTMLHFAGRELGVNGLIAGIPLLLPEGQRWIESRTGQTIAFDKLNPTRPPWKKQRAVDFNAQLMSLQAQDSYELPFRTVTEIYFDVYKSTPMRVVFPVLDLDLFQETIKLAYHPQSLGHYCRPASARACIFAFIAYASLLHPPGVNHTPDNVPPVDSEAFAIRAQCLLPQVLQDSAVLDGLQATMFLTLFELASGNLHSASHYISISSRLVFLLGAHTSPRQATKLPTSEPESLDSRQQRHARNLFWLCYTVDKDLALRTGQPLALVDDDCDLTLPTGYAKDLYTNIAYHHLPGVELPPIFPIDLQLSIKISQTYSKLYSFKGFQKTDAELLKDIRELDDSLERWRVSVPCELRPSLSFSHDRPDPNVSMFSLILRMNYYLCRSIIHQASSRCKAWAENQDNMIGVRSSLALSVEASRSTLMYLETAEHVLMGGVFWPLVFYPISAVLSVFCNILQTPSDPQATKDLELLREVTEMLERIFLRQLCLVNEVIHIKVVADFVSELYTLANCAVCAVEKAVNELGDDNISESEY